MQTPLRVVCVRSLRDKTNPKGNPVAIFHMTAKIISRKAGRSATGAAAYRAGVEITDKRTGEVHNYTRKAGVESADIIMPAVSTWTPDRSELWNAVEAKNKRADAQVAREFEVSLPDELSHDQRRRLAVDFAQEIADRYGVAADVAIHKPGKGGDSRNHHAHILTSTNRVEGEGFGNKARELDLVAHNQSGKVGQANEIDRLRERWAELTNERLHEAGIEARIDHRTLEAQGIDREPTVHLGPSVMGMERRGASSEVKKRVDAEVEARLRAAREQGEKERKEAEAQRTSMIDLSTNVTAAKANLIEAKVAEHQSGLDAKLAAFEARATALQAERDRAAAIERQRIEQLRKAEQATAFEKLLQGRQRTPERAARPRPSPSKDNDGPDFSR
jgi:ATP-dependent exoDNAse (exonuclease V) alpha subunit